MNGLFVPLTDECRAKLKELAKQERRRPNDQASMLLQDVLLGETDEDNDSERSIDLSSESISDAAMMFLDWLKAGFTHSTEQFCFDFERTEHGVYMVIKLKVMDELLQAYHRSRAK